MKKHFLTLSTLLCSLLTMAHQPSISTTLLVEQEDGSWVFQVRSALTAFEQEVHLKYGEGSYTTPEEFKELVLCHIADNLSIDFGEQGVAMLSNGFVKLGHETNVVFQVSGVPENIHTLAIKNSSFENIYGNKSVLIILKKGFEKKQFELNGKNDHTVNLKATDNAFEPRS